jgi:peptidoglycan/LPS O-acetylase OafA/YrhL
MLSGLGYAFFPYFELGMVAFGLPLLSVLRQESQILRAGGVHEGRKKLRRIFLLVGIAMGICLIPLVSFLTGEYFFGDHHRLDLLLMTASGTAVATGFWYGYRERESFSKDVLGAVGICLAIPSSVLDSCCLRRLI